MFSSLILLLILNISSTALAQEAKEVELFASSPQWHKLLYYKNQKSLIKGERYFLAQEGRVNPYQELLKTIDAFKLHQKNSEGHYYQCLFPARFQILKKKWPEIFQKQICKDFKEFAKGIDLEDVYLIYTSSYTNNPASMFGHTLLRFSRKSRGELESTKELIGYSLAFQARTDPQDNPLFYALKGIMGGYTTYVEIKPQYINVGVYNNGESRDMWENKLDFSEEEKQLLVAHAWELSIAGAFDYYFFDENCSTHLLRLLEVLRPSVDFESKKDLFVVPQVTYREILQKIGTNKDNYRASLKKRIYHQYNELSEVQKESFYLALNDHAKLKDSNVEVLDALVEYWKFKNYKAKTKLGDDDKKLMYQTLMARAKNPKISQFQKMMAPQQENPKYGHKLASIGLGAGDKFLNARFRYGFHKFSDPEAGFDQHAYINFMQIDFLQNNEEDYLQLDLIDILSIPHYDDLFSDLSWRAKLSYLNHDEMSGTLTTAAVGGASKGRSLQYYTLFSLNGFHMKSEKTLLPGINLGAKYQISNSVRWITEGNLFSEKYRADFEHKIVWDNEKYQLGIEYRINEVFDRSQVFWQYYF